MSAKRAKGQFYTVGNPFILPPFVKWAKHAGLPAARILEPFAGGNNIIKTLQEIDLCNQFVSYDIEPTNKHVKLLDTVNAFPKGFKVCITNPPWLARNSATRRELPYPLSSYDDLYKHCLELCLNNCEFVAALLPASYLQSGLFRERLDTYILLHKTMFIDTENPVCLALFSGRTRQRINIYHDAKYIGTLKTLENKIPEMRNNRKIAFNVPDGELGFISFDNTRKASIKFCHGEEVEDYSIKISSRFITRISGDFDDADTLIHRLNKMIKKFRKGTHDVFLTPFKGIRDDGCYRRRMEYSMARRIINAA